MKKKLLKRINALPRTVQAYSCECDTQVGCQSACKCSNCEGTDNSAGYQGASNNMPIRLSALQSVSSSAQR